MDVIKGYAAGDVIIEEGTKGTSAYIILTGTVDVTKRAGKGEVKMATLGERQVFGEMGLIEDRPRSATVKAMSDLKVRVIDREHFNELLRTKPSVLIPILKSLFEMLKVQVNMQFLYLDLILFAACMRVPLTPEPVSTNINEFDIRIVIIPLSNRCPKTPPFGRCPM